MLSSSHAARRAPLLLVVASVLWFGGHLTEGVRSAIVSLEGNPAEDALAAARTGSRYATAVIHHAYFCVIIIILQSLYPTSIVIF
jgi:hypothetical protein